MTLNANTRLTPDDIAEILEVEQLKQQATAELKRLEARAKAIKWEMRKVTQNQMAKYYGCHVNTIGKITRGIT